MYPVAFGWNVLYMLNPSGLICSFSPMFPFWFCLDVLSVYQSGLLKSPNIIIMMSTSPFRAVNICFICLDAPIEYNSQMLYPFIGPTYFIIIFCLLQSLSGSQFCLIKLSYLRFLSSICAEYHLHLFIFSACPYNP